MPRGSNYLTDGEKTKYDLASPDHGLALPGSAIQEVQEDIGLDTDSFYPLLQFTYAIVADGSSGLTMISSLPYAIEILDVIVQARATSASGVALVSDGTNDITNSIAMATDTNIARAGTIDDAYSSLSAGDSLVVTTNGSNDRGLVTVIFRKA